ncbi:MAG: SH3 domain-containing protein [Faecousia sp.]
MSIALDDFLKQIEAICAAKPDYRTGGSGTDGTCDCIGLIIGAVRRAGGSWKGIHGSNYAARFQMASLKKLKMSELFIGEVVFKAKSPEDSSYSLPDRYKPGGASSNGDVLDYYHVGVVTRVSPLEITHCSTAVNGNSIHRDTSLGKWKYGGRLKGVDYEKMDSAEKEQEQMEEVIMQELRCSATVTGGRLSLRQAPTTTAVRLAWIPNGARVEVTGQTDDWCAVSYDGIAGYAMRRFLILDTGNETQEGPEKSEAQDELLPQTEEERLAELERRVEEQESRLANLETRLGRLEID